MRYETSVTIAASPHDVWTVLADVEGWPSWTPSVRSVDALDGAAFGVGCRFRISQPRMPAMVWEITRVDRGRGFTWETTMPGIRVVGDHELADDGHGRVVVTLRIEQNGPLAWLATAANAGRTRRYVDLEAHSLRARCEHGVVRPRPPAPGV